jgi:hypothetical protein
MRRKISIWWEILLAPCQANKEAGTSMKRIAMATIGLFAFCAAMISAQERYTPVRISVRPVVDIPIGPDANLFKLSGGGAVSGSYIFPGFRAFSAGAAVNYHVGRMSNVDLGDLGSLSTVSVEATAEIRGTLGGLIELSLTGSAGYFYAFRNDNPSLSASNLVWGTGAGIGVVITPTLTLGVFGEYRNLETLYRFIGIGIRGDLLIGGKK